MKPVRAWAVVIPRKLHRMTARIPSISDDIVWVYPVYTTRREAKVGMAGWERAGLNPRMVEVEIREVET